LGYTDTDQAIRKHCKNAVTIGILNPEVFSGLELHLIFGNNYKSTKLILESDVWRLVIKSKLPKAEKIETWIMEYGLAFVI
jgi:prophage antirepressor-like protein